MNYPIIPLITLIVSSIYTPGPNNLMCMALGQKIGFKKTSKYIMGACLGYACMLTSIYLFNSVLYRLLPSIDTALSILGGIYLCYLAWCVLKGSKNKLKKSESIIPEDKLFVAAFFLQFINMKAVVFSLMIFSTFVFPYFQDIPRVAILITGLVVATFSSLNLWAWGGSFLNKFITNHEKVFNIVMALALLYCAFSIARPDKLFLL